jgi:hypothetical protein
MRYGVPKTLSLYVKKYGHLIGEGFVSLKGNFEFKQ